MGDVVRRNTAHKLTLMAHRPADRIRRGGWGCPCLSAAHPVELTLRNRV